MIIIEWQERKPPSLIDYTRRIYLRPDDVFCLDFGRDDFCLVLRQEVMQNDKLVKRAYGDKLIVKKDGLTSEFNMRERQGETSRRRISLAVFERAI